MRNIKEPVATQKLIFNIKIFKILSIFYKIFFCLKIKNKIITEAAERLIINSLLLVCANIILYLSFIKEKNNYSTEKLLFG